jgi:preprotein translocase subunit SecA
MEAGILSKQIEGAQKKVEEQNFVTRKNVLKYDDVMNTQRMVIYDQRSSVLAGEDLSGDISDWIDSVVERIVFEHTQGEPEEWDIESLFTEISSLYETEVEPSEIDPDTMTQADVVAEFQDDARDAYAAKEEELGPELMREIERYLVLQVVDVRWREHLESMEYLRDGIHLRAMAQKDPLAEYRAEGAGMFDDLGETIREEVVRYLMHVEIAREEAETLQPEAPEENLVYEHESLAGAEALSAAGAAAPVAAPGAVAQAAPSAPAATVQQTVRHDDADPFQSVGRNDPCPCGSGKKYKRCHGA